MSFYVNGNPPINSTYAPVNNPSTTALLAELDSSNFAPNDQRHQKTYVVNISLGGSTGGYWVVEQAASTAIVAAPLDAVFYRTASGQTSQFVRKYKLAATDRIRVRHVSSVTGLFEASLQAEELA
jgi:hypothetical protein